MRRGNTRWVKAWEGKRKPANPFRRDRAFLPSLTRKTRPRTTSPTRPRCETPARPTSLSRRAHHCILALRALRRCDLLSALCGLCPSLCVSCACVLADGLSAHWPAARVLVDRNSTNRLRKLSNAIVINAGRAWQTRLQMKAPVRLLKLLTRFISLSSRLSRFGQPSRDGFPQAQWIVKPRVL